MNKVNTIFFIPYIYSTSFIVVFFAMVIFFLTTTYERYNSEDTGNTPDEQGYHLQMPQERFLGVGDGGNRVQRHRAKEPTSDGCSETRGGFAVEIVEEAE